jgi:hypothetical protein
MVEVQTYLIQGTSFEISKQPNESPTRFVRIGDRVKVMIKGYSAWETYVGVVASFDNYKDLPTFNIVYVDASYSKAEIKTIPYNEESVNVKVSFPDPNAKELDIDKESILSKFDRQIEAKKNELTDLYYMRSYFDKNFGKIFSGV